MPTTNSRAGRAVLMTSHCAGMVDMVALPVWVGTLIAAYQFDPQRAGGLVTLFLIGAVLASIVFAPRFNRISGHGAATLGFGGACLAFLAASMTSDFAMLAALHAIGGFAAGTGLSFTHGTIGRSENPHRLFGMVGLALGVFAVPFLGATPQLVAAFGGPALFRVFALVMFIAAVLAALAFPTPDAESAVSKAYRETGKRLPGAVWFGIVGVSSMALVQAMVFSFVERMGADRGFGVASVSAVLIALGIVNMFPAGIAAVLEKRLDPRKVMLVGPVVQAVLAIVVSQSLGFLPYAMAASVFVAVMLFTHTFAFGQLAKLDVTGRAVAATPAMVMIGSAMGPILGGTIIQAVGYSGLGLAAIVIDLIALAMFMRMNREPRRSIGALA